MSERILVADDEEVVRANLQEFLASNGYVVDTAPDGQKAL